MDWCTLGRYLTASDAVKGVPCFTMAATNLNEAGGTIVTQEPV